MKQVHFVLQGKGGVGKSLIASFFAQHQKSQGKNIQCFDTDPVNQTFMRFKALDVKQINIMTEDKTIDTSRFDGLIEVIANSDSEVFIIDNGAATFIPLMNYMLDNRVMDDIFTPLGIKVIIHVPVVGGQAMEDSLLGLQYVMKSLPTPVVVWVNHYWGKVDGVDSWQPIKQHKSKVLGIVDLKRYTPDTFGKDLTKMMSDALTIDEVMASKNYGLMQKHRIKVIKSDIFNQLDNVFQGDKT